MASTINAKNTSTGVVITPDASGQLELQTADTTRMTIDANGNVGIGTSSPTVPLEIYNPTLSSILTVGDAAVTNVMARYSSDANSPFFTFRKARGTYASPSAVTTNDSAGFILFNAYGGSTFRQIATIQGVVENYVSDTNISGQIRFSTNAGGTTVTERMRITSNGGVAFGGASNFGTSGQVLQSNGDAAPSWVDSRGMTLLGTLTTTSGATQTLSGLDLTDYKTLIIYLNNVSSSSTATIRLNSIVITQATGATGNSVWGECSVNLSVGTFAAISSATVSSTGTLSNTGITNNGNCGVTSAATSLVFSPSAGSFDAGTITVYGVS